MIKYAEYKDSQIPWVGQVPAHWGVQKLKTLLSRKSETGRPDETVLSLYRDYGVIPKDSRSDNHNRTSDNTDSYRVVAVDDLVVNKMKAWQGSLAVSQFDGIVSPAYFVYRLTSSKLFPRYLHYATRNPSYIPEYKRLSGGIRPDQWDLSPEGFSQILYPIPPFDEQVQISNYLDRTLGEIDTLVEETEKSIELLEEYRKSVISEAVTKGLDPDVPMKDSGIEWIGEIPAHWKIAKVATFGRAVLGRMLDEKTAHGDNMRPYLSNKDVQWFSINEINLNQMSFPENSSNRYDIEDGDILICEGGEVGRCAVYRGSSAPYSFQKAIHRLRVNQQLACPEFIVLQLFQKATSTSFIEVRKGESTIAHLPGDQLSQLRFLLPPIEEQRAIAGYLSNINKLISGVVNENLALVRKLQEYRKSLISEAVTGKFKVPGVE